MSRANPHSLVGRSAVIGGLDDGLVISMMEHHRHPLVRKSTVDEINAVLEAAAQDSRWSNVWATTRDALVSSDIVGDPHGAIVDLALTKVIDGNLCAVYSWYDNEFGFTNTLLSHVMTAAELRQTAGQGQSGVRVR
jgi:glyceraldehyde-3-phosphate dehydrogenase/erythrose-4-phosphate dehydrogenase